MKSANRIYQALENGWSFGPLKPPPNDTIRGYIWIKHPDEEGWRAHKAHGKFWLKEALNEAGVP